MSFSEFRHIACLIAIGVLGILALLSLVRAIIGPRISDRIVGVNLIGTQVIGMIVLTAVLLGEEGFVDIALVYAILNFLSVVVLTRIFIAAYRRRIAKKEEEKA